MMVGPLRQTRQAMPVFGTYRGPVYGHEHRVLHPPGQLFRRDVDFAGGVFNAAGPEQRFDRLLLLWSELYPATYQIHGLHSVISFFSRRSGSATVLVGASQILTESLA